VRRIEREISVDCDQLRDGEPALRSPNSKVGKVPQRFRTQELAQAAADQLKAEQQNDRGQ
jgi:hypothetical protein